MRDIFLTAQGQIEDHVDEHQHGTVGLDSLFEVMFGIEHIIAEFFWNAVFLLIGFAFSKAIALRKIHKYIDDKHGVKHQKEDY
jgi:hypothetical protein